jgi:hypothetical protein
MTGHKTGTHEEWLEARLDLLEPEKELTPRSNDLAQRRQQLPWVCSDREYRFQTDDGRPLGRVPVARSCTRIDFLNHFCCARAAPLASNWRSCANTM